MKFIKITFLAAISLLMVTSCSEADLQNLQKATNQLNKPAPLTNDEVIRGLKEALRVGINNAGGLASRLDGYFKNPRIMLPFPPEAKNIEDKLRSIGLGSLCDKFIESLNRGAEKAAGQAAPIFVQAITSMSISDGFQILRGGQTAATDYLKRTTTAQLTQAFRPVIQQSLDQVSATKYWSDITTAYNKIPFVQKMNPDLPGYATGKAIDGLFLLVADEEGKIRKDPAARVNDILKRVFGQQ